TNTSGLPTLTSGGAPVTYSVVGNTLTASAGGHTVFTLQVQSNGNYTFTLQDQLDHPAGNGENHLILDLTSAIQATAKDGDPGTLSPSAFPIDVQDDVPVQSQATVSGAVEEDDLNNAQSVGNNEDGSVGKTVATGSIASLVLPGADEPASFSLNTSTSGLPTLTSGGVAVTYSVVGDTLTAKAGALTVFTLQVHADGTYTFTLQDQLDHPAGNGENHLILNLTSAIQATDKDGDTLTLAGSAFTIDVQDDVPVQSQATGSGAGGEDDLNNAQSVGNNEDGSVGKTVATGSVAGLVLPGADEPASFGLNTNTSGLPTLTSGGVAVTYSVVGSTLTASAGGHTVFTLQLNSNGTYTFTLQDQLDHPAGNGENHLILNLTSAIQATDKDGDTITLSGSAFTIDVQDDVPVQSQATVSGAVEEDDLNNAQSVGNNEDGSVGKTVATGSIASLVLP